MFGVLTVCLIMLAGCVHLVQLPTRLLASGELDSYALYVATCALLMLWAAARLTRYRYVRPPPDSPPIFQAHRLK